MIKLLRLSPAVLVSIFFVSCAVFSTSMTPSQVNNALPTLTESKFISLTQAQEVVEANRGKYLVRGREYTVPIGFTVQNELRKGAEGIDEWVKFDGGNAYVLVSYKWVTVDHNGSTQLHMEFDTMLCE